MQEMVSVDEDSALYSDIVLSLHMKSVTQYKEWIKVLPLWKSIMNTQSLDITWVM